MTTSEEALRVINSIKLLSLSKVIIQDERQKKLATTNFVSLWMNDPG